VNDVYQYEYGFAVQTQTRHKTPTVRANSISSLSHGAEKKKLRIPRTVEESDSSGHGPLPESDSSDYLVGKCPTCSRHLPALPPYYFHRPGQAGDLSSLSSD
jgi:hypothetical protein